MSDVWRMLRQSADAQPPFFYWIERLASHLSSTEEIAYRLPSIIAFPFLLLLLFLFVKKRASGWIALLCCSLPLLMVLNYPFSVEARPYEMVVACFALAVICYQRVPAIPWTILMGLSFVLAESLHYYAIFSIVPFMIAEIALFIKSRRFRAGVWLAFASGALPLIVCWPLLEQLREFYGKHPWNVPNLHGVVGFYAWSFQFLIRSLTIDVLLLMAFVAGAIALYFPRVRSALLSDPDFHQYVLLIVMLGTPFLAFVAAKVAHGGVDNRYALSAVLAFPLGAGFLLPRLNRTFVLLLAVFLFFPLVRQEATFWSSERGHLGRMVSPAIPVENLVAAAGHPDLPGVISEGFVYFQLFYYASPDWVARFVSVVDPIGSVAYTGNDTIDKNLIVLARYYPMRVIDFSDFAASHRSFLLYSSGGSWDWWAARLTHDGYSLRIVASDQGKRVYLVSLGKFVE